MIIDPKKVKFKAVRASGPGGQRANRRSTKVQLWVSIKDLPINKVQKKMIQERLWHHINKKGEIWVADEEERSQEQNRDKALEHLNSMVEHALQVKPPRIPTKPSRSFEDVRIRAKKIQSVKKQNRRSSHRLP